MLRFWRSTIEVQMRSGSGLPMTGTRSVETTSAELKVAIGAWISASGLADGRVFRPVNQGDKVQGEAMSEKVAWQMLQQYATDAGVPGIAPHDCRSYAESRTMPNEPVAPRIRKGLTVRDAA
jgi:hypothetical protein